MKVSGTGGCKRAILSVPTPEMYTGDFSNWVDAEQPLLQIYDPTTTRPNPNGVGFVRDPFPNNQIPQSMFSTDGAKDRGVRQRCHAESRFAPGTSGYVRQNYIVSGRHACHADRQVEREGDQLRCQSSRQFPVEHDDVPE
jgi:hypothetical protein